MTENTTTPSHPSANSPPPRPTEHNPRWKGYLYMSLCSLVHFASIANVKRGSEYHGILHVALLFGLVSCACSILILLLDRTQCWPAPKFNYTTACDGRLEGYALILFCVWWIVGVAYTTQVNGLAYSASNIYFSSWAALIACVYTLNKWSTAKDILSIKELTGISETLPSWYVLAISSMVVAGTSADLITKIDPDNKDLTSYALFMGLVSTVVALFFILVHYNFIDVDFLREGGSLELCTSFFLILMWIVGTAIFTQDGGIAATISGVGGCHDSREQIPGSNLYLFCWICFFTSLNISLRWTAAQAMQFAQAQNRTTTTDVDSHIKKDDSDEDSLSDEEDDF